MSESTDATTPKVRKSLYNTFNKMLLLTTNILVSDEVAIKKELKADYTNNRLALRFDRSKCLEYDKQVFQVDDTEENDDAIDAIVNKFYDYVQALQKRLGDGRSILFVNPLFNEFDGVFQGPDGVHDVEPRGDMQGSSIIKKTPNMSAAGGWRLIDKEVGKNGKALFHDAIMRSTLVPNQEYCDDTAKLVIIKQAKWNTGFITNPDTVPVPSLNPNNGHLFLDPAETERMICNVTLPAVQKFEGTDFDKIFSTKVTDNDPNTIYDIKYNGGRDVFDIQTVTKKLRELYLLNNFVHNLGISDCSGPSPEQLQLLLGAEEGPQTGVQSAGQSGGAKTLKDKKKKKNNRTDRVVSVISSFLDSSSGNDTGGLGALLEASEKTDVASGQVGPAVLDSLVTFYLPHTRWTLNNPVFSILYVYQVVDIDATTDPTKPTYNIRFEANVSPNSLACPNQVPIFTGKSFEITENDKCPGVNETIRYILSNLGPKFSKKGNELNRIFAKGLYPNTRDDSRYMQSAKDTSKFFTQFNTTFTELWNYLKNNKIDSTINVSGGKGPNTKYTELGINEVLFKAAFFFRQKTMGDFVRLADAAYLNEKLFAREKPLGIAVEGTCDKYSRVKGFASRNVPIFYAGNKWGRDMSIYSPLQLDPGEAAKAAAAKAEQLTKDKLSALNSKITTMLKETTEKVTNDKLDELNSKLNSWIIKLNKEWEDAHIVFLEDVIDSLRNLDIDDVRQNTIIDDNLYETGYRAKNAVRISSEKLEKNKVIRKSLFDCVENRISILLFLIIIQSYIDVWSKTQKNASSSFGSGLTATADDEFNNRQAITKLENIVSQIPPLDLIENILQLTIQDVPESNSEDSKVFELELKGKDNDMIVSPAFVKDLDSNLYLLLSQKKGTTVTYTSLVDLLEAYNNLREMNDTSNGTDLLAIPKTSKLIITGNEINSPVLKLIKTWIKNANQSKKTDPPSASSNVPGMEIDGDTGNPPTSDISNYEKDTKKSDEQNSYLASSTSLIKVKSILTSDQDLIPQQIKINNKEISRILARVESTNRLLRRSPRFSYNIRGSRQGGSNNQRGGNLELESSQKTLLDSLTNVSEYYKEKIQKEEEEKIQGTSNTSSTMDIDQTVDTNANGLSSDQEDDIVQSINNNITSLGFNLNSDETFSLFNALDESSQYMPTISEVPKESKSSITEEQTTTKTQDITQDDAKRFELIETTDVNVVENSNTFFSFFNKQFSVLGLLRWNSSIDCFIRFNEIQDKDKYPYLEVSHLNDNSNVDFFYNILSIANQMVIYNTNKPYGFNILTTTDVDLNINIGLYYTPTINAIFKCFFLKNDGDNLTKKSKDEIIAYSGEHKSIKSIMNSDTQTMSFKNAFRCKLAIMFHHLIAQDNLFQRLFFVIIPEIFFETITSLDNSEKYTRLKASIAKKIIVDQFNVNLKEEYSPFNETGDEISWKNDTELHPFIIVQWNAIAVCVLIYSDNVCRDLVTEIYFNKEGTSLMFYPDTVEGYGDYYRTLGNNNNSFPIPVEEQTIAYQIYKRSKPKRPNDPIKNVTGYSEYCYSTILTNLIKPVINYFLKTVPEEQEPWDKIRVNSADFEKKVMVYLFGLWEQKGLDWENKAETTGTAGILTNSIVPEIDALGLSQVNGDRTAATPYVLTYSIEEIGEILAAYVGANAPADTIEFDKPELTIAEWKNVTVSTPIELLGRPDIPVNEGIQELLAYKDFNDEPVFPENATEKYALNGLYQKLLEDLASKNPFNREVARYSLLSKQIGTWLSDFEQLTLDMTSAANLELIVPPGGVGEEFKLFGGKRTYKKRPKKQKKRGTFRKRR